MATAWTPTALLSATASLLQPGPQNAGPPCQAPGQRCGRSRDGQNPPPTVQSHAEKHQGLNTAGKAGFHDVELFKWILFFEAKRTCYFDENKRNKKRKGLYELKVEPASRLIKHS